VVEGHTVKHILKVGNEQRNTPRGLQRTLCGVITSTNERRVGNPEDNSTNISI